MDLPPKTDSVLRYVEDGPALGVTEDFDDIRHAEFEEIARVRQPTTSRTAGHGPES